MPKAFLLKRAVEGETSTIYGNSNNVNSDGESLTQTSGFRDTLKTQDCDGPLSQSELRWSSKGTVAFESIDSDLPKFKNEAEVDENNNMIPSDDNLIPSNKRKGFYQNGFEYSNVKPNNLHVLLLAAQQLMLNENNEAGVTMGIKNNNNNNGDSKSNFNKGSSSNSRATFQQTIGSLKIEDNRNKLIEHNYGNTRTINEAELLSKSADADDSTDSISSDTGNDSNDRRPKYQCKQCGKVFKTRYTLTIHLRMPDHTKSRPFVCNVCGKGFRLSSTLCRHKIIHTQDKPHKCHVCSKAFNRSSTLKTHVKTHSVAKEFACKICGKGFHQKGNLRNHVLIHTGEKPFECNLCEKAFNKLSNLKFHMQTHDETRGFAYSCRLCGQMFEKKLDYREHMRQSHESE